MKIFHIYSLFKFNAFFKALFPQSPGCLVTASREVLTAVDVWFAADVSRQSSCPSGNWGDTHCDRRIRTMYNVL